MSQSLDKSRALANWSSHVGESVACSPAQMSQRIARYHEIPSSARAFVDTYLPGHERKLHSVIGLGVTDDPAFRPAIAAAENFHVDYITAASGRGAALHAHDTEEVFVAVRGRWMVYWLDLPAGSPQANRHETVLQECDVISVPPGVMRGFASVDGETGLLLSILGGKTPSKVKWDRSVALAARARGVGFDDAGNAVRFD